tara:strand:+ start:447 stop:653 length:207 start_codon:yes stop_codon:yes gene_type:complete
MSSAKEQTAARYVIQFLLEDGQTMMQIARRTGIHKSALTAFYRGIHGHDLTPSEIGKLERLHDQVTTE